MSSLTEAEISSMARVKWWGRRMRLVVLLVVVDEEGADEDGDVDEGDCNSGDRIDGIGIIEGGGGFDEESSGEDGGEDGETEDESESEVADAELGLGLADS